MDFFYSNFLEGLKQKNLAHSNLSDITSLVSPLSKKYHPTVILGFYMPKTASSFLIDVIEDLTKFTVEDLSWGYLQNEQNLCMNRLINNSSKPVISKLIATATTPTIDLLKLFSIKPFVITRSILDVIVSLRDHMVNYQEYLWPQLHLQDDFLTFSRQKQYDLLIDSFVPWMITFLQSWKATSVHFPDLLWITYEDICNDLKSVLESIFQYYDCDVVINNVDHYFESKESSHGSYQNRFNVGISGRGRQELSAKQIKRVTSFFSHYPDLLIYL